MQQADCEYYLHYDEDELRESSAWRKPFARRPFVCRFSLVDLPLVAIIIVVLLENLSMGFAFGVLLILFFNCTFSSTRKHRRVIETFM